MTVFCCCLWFVILAIFLDLFFNFFIFFFSVEGSESITLSQEIVNPGTAKLGPEDFELKKVLGKGGYGKVFQVCINFTLNSSILEVNYQENFCIEMAKTRGYARVKVIDSFTGLNMWNIFLQKTLQFFAKLRITIATVPPYTQQLLWVSCEKSDIAI